MLRSEIREEIFKIMFRLSFNTREEMEEQIAYSLDELSGKSDKNINYVNDKTHAIMDKLKDIDDKITECCEGWTIDRIGKAELTIMRIATYEIMFEEEVPNSVAINEAVELSKAYCDEDAKGFVNAVLGKIVKSVE
ncbi:MAG: transcription antitermination factor NusB [Lachnospiraceae bacterium]|jgi:N utilization substance protein B|nr:transcription antitermination factor NusB [Lachnospiraceae bacterium]